MDDLLDMWVCGMSMAQRKGTAVAPERRRSSSVPPPGHDIKDEEPPMPPREMIFVVERLEWLQDLLVFLGNSCSRGSYR